MTVYHPSQFLFCDLNVFQAISSEITFSNYTSLAFSFSVSVLHGKLFAFQNTLKPLILERCAQLPQTAFRNLLISTLYQLANHYSSAVVSY